MKTPLLLSLMVAIMPIASYASSPSDHSAYLGMSASHSNVSLGKTNEVMGGIDMQAGLHVSDFRVKGRSSALHNHNDKLESFGFAVDKPITFLNHQAFVAPEVGIDYARYKNDWFKETDFGPEAGVNLGYNLGKNVVVETSYRHTFGMTNSEQNLDQDIINLGLNYHFN
ncbi:outer membrane beta-barrel protein [Vibrio ostreicida]|uniref:Outer membrane beta-barrel protein n=1 Tax=Vibrio ostreicida TaxID=526588 RepID=A0ABT8BRY2_9VIBR|nr:outer membrane beta-barrel protein [Vibrio ostreicida]MDN3609902.1 outer membrane beta-barrel protein [Vibrio ostreicida]NPD10021.1 outer membrane beta-barrel protein [Vibrio ostreicida]